MKVSDLRFEYPDELVALAPSRPTRVMWVGADYDSKPEEISLRDLIDRVPVGDIFVINNTKVLKRRVFTDDGIEILFLNKVVENLNSNAWSVLFPSKKYAEGDELTLPNGFKAKLLQKGRPQYLEIFPSISESDFEKMAELPLPPYIQKLRDQRHNVHEDTSWYQSAWAKNAGSLAAPTASLHFTKTDIEVLKSRGVKVIELTLHVGLGTFLPVVVEDLNQHEMHYEDYEINSDDWNAILKAKLNGNKIWALGTTSTRVLESVARSNRFFGRTNLLLRPGSDFNIVDRLLTNFHQPESTLLALVAGFSGLDKVQSSYHWAINKKFKLFSYGDLSVWLK